ncbi:MAG TPA: hypothetical protein VFB12_24130 [Ktedonobacteraceae bacterium]|nr:hypothetical protein [Ktedonobacteraceae bacterium]
MNTDDYEPLMAAQLINDALTHSMQDSEGVVGGSTQPYPGNAGGKREDSLTRLALHLIVFRRRSEV